MPAPKKSLSQKVNEEREDKYYKADEAGIKKDLKRKEKVQVVKNMNENEKVKLMDFIFGKSNENPLEELNKRK